MESGVVSIHGKKYKTVSRRVSEFREQHPLFTISTEVLSCAEKVLVKASIIDEFFKFAQAEQKREAEAIIASENLDEEAARRYIAASLKREYASENGTALNDALPKLSPLNPKYRTLKQTVFNRVSAFVEKFKGVGGNV